MMKKLFFILIVASCAFALNAQDKNIANSLAVDYTLTYDQYRYDYTTTSATANSFTTTDSLWSFTFHKQSAKPLKFDVFVVLDSVGGTSNQVNVKVQGKKALDQTSWTDLKTLYWTSGVDTTKLLTEASTAQQYPYFRVYLEGQDNTFIAKVTKLIVKFWE